MRAITVMVAAVFSCFLCGPSVATFVTGPHEQLTYQERDEVDPMVNPAGTLITFRGGVFPEEANIYILDMASRELTNLNPDQGASQTPAFTRDGNFILYHAGGDPALGGDPNHGDIWRMNVDGTGQTPVCIINGLSEAMPNELPDGRIVVHTWDPTWSISIMDPDESGLDALTALPCVSDAAQPRVSLDARYITYHSQSPPGTPYEIYLFDLTTSVEKQLTFEDGVEQGYPSFSPSGNWIVYQSKEDGGLSFDLWVMDLDGGNRQQLTFEDVDQCFPQFLPDGSGIIYSSPEDGGSYYDLWVVPIPEPSIVVLVALGVPGLLLRRKAR